MINDVTAVITTFRNDDFTNASVYALRQHYPDIPIIFADGSPEGPMFEWDNRRVVWIPNECTDTLRNAASTLVETPYVLFMDNDVKVQSAEALPLLIDTLDYYDEGNVAQTGAYGVIKTSHAAAAGIVGTVFDGYTEVDMMPCYFALHRMDAFREVGGFPLRPPYAIPEHLWKGVKLPAYAGDLTIGLEYQKHGWINLTPRATVPVLHWEQANRWMGAANREFDDWWYANVKHTRQTPLRGKV